MIRDEIITVLGIIKATYPAFYKDMKKEEAELIVNLWTTMFESDEAKVVTEAVRAYIATDTKGFPPVMGQIKEKIRNITQPDRMTEMEAWGMVQKAIQGAIYRGQENFDSLPPMIQKIVGSPNQLREWAMMDTETVNSVVQSNFMRSFTAKQKQVETYQALPESTKAMIAGLSKKFELQEGTE